MTDDESERNWSITRCYFMLIGPRISAVGHKALENADIEAIGIDELLEPFISFSSCC